MNYWWVNWKKGEKKPNMANKVVIKDHGFKATDSAQNKANRNNYCNFFPDLNLLKGTSFRQMAKKKKYWIYNMAISYLSPETPWQPQKLAHPITSAQVLTLTENIHLIQSSQWSCQCQEANCTGGEKPLNSTFLGGRAGWERQLLGAHKKIHFHLFSQVKSKGLPNCLDTNMHLSKQNTDSLPSLEHSDG